MARLSMVPTALHRLSRAAPAAAVLGFAALLFVQPAFPAPAVLPAGEDAATRLAALARQAPPKPSGSAQVGEWCKMRVHERKARRLLEAYRRSPAFAGLFDAELDAMRSAMARLDSLALDRRPASIPAGFREEGYHADNDDSYQPFLRFLPATAPAGKGLPLLVYLHGYSPDLDIVNWAALPEPVTNFAQRAGAAVVAPFGRGNTDFQGIGEQDVLRVVDEALRRYPLDPDRIVLLGYSMGGMGAWTLAAHHPGRFAGVLVVSGRGDYYTWKGIRPGDVPPFKRRLVDADFGCSLATNLASCAILNFHGALDPLVPVGEARRMAQAVRAVNARYRYVELAAGSHWILGDVLARDDARAWLLSCRRAGAPATLPPDPPAGRFPSAVKQAFLSPFVFVDATGGRHAGRFDARVAEWADYAKAAPRTRTEGAVRRDELAAFNVFLFGEPETSALIREAVRESAVGIGAGGFTVAGRTVPREGRGLWLAARSPWNPERVAVVQCGVAWGDALPPNHKYDMLPDFIVYTGEHDADGCNRAECAGFFDSEWRIVPELLYENAARPRSPIKGTQTTP